MVFLEVGDGGSDVLDLLIFEWCNIVRVSDKQ